LAVLALRSGKTALACLACIFVITENLFITKQILLFNFCVTCTDAFAVGGGIILNLIQEYYGPKYTKKVISLTIFSLIIFIVLAQIHLLYIPDILDSYHIYFSKILSYTPRILASSLIAFSISQTLDFYLYKYFKQKFSSKSNKYFILRNYGSLLISQLLDTGIFTVLALYGLFNNLLNLFFFSYLIKILTILISIPVISITKKYISQAKQENTF